MEIYFGELKITEMGLSDLIHKLHRDILGDRNDVQKVVDCEYKWRVSWLSTSHEMVDKAGRQSQCWHCWAL